MKEDVLKGYKVGADDYLKKPFDSDVLLFKIKAILKRNKLSSIIESEETEFSFSSFHFNSKLRHLSYNKEKEVKLSPKENMLLKLLLIHKNDLMPRELALTRIWHDDNYFTSRSMDVYIAKLRKQLQKDPNVTINNIHGEGFRLIVK
jgi:DNA-binding response OmpR family regulator